MLTRPLDLDAFIVALRGRGLELRLVGNKLQAFDASGKHAWPALRPDEQAFTRAHRQALKRRLQDGPRPTEPTAPEPESPTSPRAPEKRCSYCGGRPCVGQDHAAYRTLHARDPEEVERRRLEKMQRHDATLQGWRLAGITRPEY